MTGRRSSAALVVVAAAGLTALAAGCPGLSAGAGARPDGHRLVEGTLKLAEDFVIGRQVSGVQVAAVSVREVDGAPSLEVHASDVFSPDAGKAVPFALSLPTGKAFHLVLQTPTAGGAGPGRWLGVLRFDDGQGRSVTLIPAGDEDLTLAALDALENAAGQVADNELRGPASHNPLGQVDSDGDGQSDLLDADDDDDQAPDLTDSDVAGDGIDDALQSLEYLPDADGNGVPDDFE